MPSNVEIKAHIADIDAFKDVACQISDDPVSILKQEDTFFNTSCPTGRLKLRQIQDAKSQLIFYDRPVQKGPKFSEFHYTFVEDPESLKVTLGKAYGVRGVVKKTRFLYMVGQTRVHVDSVEGLGDFMELEVMMKPTQTVEEGQAIATDLMKKLGVKDCDLIDVAYMDLILQKQNGSKFKNSS